MIFLRLYSSIPVVSRWSLNRIHWKYMFDKEEHWAMTRICCLGCLWNASSPPSRGRPSAPTPLPSPSSPWPPSSFWSPVRQYYWTWGHEWPHATAACSHWWELIGLLLRDALGHLLDARHGGHVQEDLWLAWAPLSHHSAVPFSVNLIKQSHLKTDTLSRF